VSSFQLMPSLAPGAILFNDPTQVRVFLHTMPDVGLQLAYHMLGELTLKADRKIGPGVLLGSALTGPEYELPLPPTATRCKVWSVSAATRTQRTAAFAVLTWSKSQPIRYLEAEVGGPFDRVRVDGDVMVALDRGAAADMRDMTPSEDYSAAHAAIKNDACAAVLSAFVAHRAAAWKTGMHGGAFATYYGVDRNDEAVCAVIDFNLIRGGLLGPHHPAESNGETLELIKTGLPKTKPRKRPSSMRKSKAVKSTSATTTRRGKKKSKTSRR
jgi:hypothetical protein